MGFPQDRRKKLCVWGLFRARGLGWSPAQVLPFLAGFGSQRFGNLPPNLPNMADLNGMLTSTPVLEWKKRAKGDENMQKRIRTMLKSPDFALFFV